MSKVENSDSQPDHTLQAAQLHQVQAISVADMKANMLLTMSSVVLTLSLLQLLNNSQLWPLYILITTSLLTICLATYVVMPQPPPANQPAPDIQNPQFNLLHFCDFTRLSQSQFEGAMVELMNDPGRTNNTPMREIYLAGLFIAQKKHRFLRLGYLAFSTGLFCLSSALSSQLGFEGPPGERLSRNLKHP